MASRPREGLGVVSEWHRLKSRDHEPHFVCVDINVPTLAGLVVMMVDLLQNCFVPREIFDRQRPQNLLSRIVR